MEVDDLKIDVDDNVVKTSSNSNLYFSDDLDFDEYDLELSLSLSHNHFYPANTLDSDHLSDDEQKKKKIDDSNNDSNLCSYQQQDQKEVKFYLPSRFPLAILFHLHQI